VNPDEELSAEIESHIRIQAAEYMARGMNPEEAMRAARRDFGNVTAVREKCWEAHRLPLWHGLAQDLRFAFRLTGRNPGFTTLAVLLLALGLGANTALFTVFDALVWKPLPIHNPGELVIVNEGSFSYPVFRGLREASRDVFSGIYATSGEFGIYRVRLESARDTEAPHRVFACFVSSEFFSVLGLKPVAGGFFTGPDDPASPAAVVSHAFWERQLGADPAVAGRRITLNNVQLTIVGVAPRGFLSDTPGQAPDVWIPIAMQPAVHASGYLETRNFYWLNVFARLRPGVTPEHAESILRPRYVEIAKENDRIRDRGGDEPAEPPVYTFNLLPGGRGGAGLRNSIEPALRVLFAMVGLVLLIACCNVANLLLTRAAARHRETAIRLAIGCSRPRLVRQFLVECLLLAALAAAAGCGLAYLGVRLFVYLISARIQPGALPVEPDFRTFAFLLAAAMAVAIAVGLYPALRVTARPAHQSLHNTLSPLTARRSRRLLGRALVAAQISLSLFLLVAAGLLTRTVLNLRSLPAGFQPDHVLLAAVNEMDVFSQPDPSNNAKAFTIHERLGALPGVRSASLSSFHVLSGYEWTSRLAVEGRAPQPGDRGPTVLRVSPGYFRTLGLPLLGGRDFTARDATPPARFAIVNATLARRFFDGPDPVGRRISLSNRFDPRETWEIIGVAADFRFNDLRQEPEPMLYLPLFGSGSMFHSVELRFSGDPAAAASLLRRTLAEEKVVVREVRTLARQIDIVLTNERTFAATAVFFAVLAALVAFIGLYASVAHTVAQRTNEFGVRLALGAQPRALLRAVFGETLRLAAAAIVLGGAAALAVSHLLASFLYGVEPNDPLTLAAAALAVFALAIVAALRPALRATRIQPADALRCE
jgi:predicted permease